MKTEVQKVKGRRQKCGWGTAALALVLLVTQHLFATEPAPPPPPAAAETTAGQPAAPPRELDGIVVTASRTARDTDTIPANVTVITAEKIAATTAQSVPEVLKHEAGIQVADYSGTGRQTSVDIRGFGETADRNTLVLVNGRRLNSPDSMNGVDWTTIPLERIERIEIVRGGGAVLYGDKAVGGVINIITKKGAPKNTLTSETAVGSYRSFRQALGFAGRHGPFDYALNGSYADSKGYRDNGFFRNKTTGLSLSYDDPERCNWFAADLNAGVKQDRYGLPGSLLLKPGQDRTSTLSPNDFSESESAYLQLTPKFKLGDDTRLELGLKHSETESRTKWTKYKMDRKNRVTESGLSPKLVANREIAGMEHEFITGVDYTTTEREPLKGDTTPNITRTEAGCYLNDTVALVPEKLFLDAGYRRTRLGYDYADSRGSAAYDINSYRAGLTYTYAPKSKLFVSADRAFRTMLMSGELTGANPPILPPQTDWQYQTGVSHCFNRYLTLGATAFVIDTTNEIFYNPDTKQNTNYPETQRRGVELSAASDPFDTLHLFTNYTVTDARLGDGAYDGNRIPGVATHTLQAGATWSPLEQIDLDLRARWLDDRFAIADWHNVTPDSESSRFLVVDAKLTYKPTKWLKLYAGVNNIFNEEYSEYSVYTASTKTVGFYPSPTRNFVAGLVITKEF